MDILIVIIIAVAVLSIVLWAIRYVAPADLQRPLTVVAVAIFLVWLLSRVWPYLAVR